MIDKIIQLLRIYPDARVMDIMAEFDLSDTEALAALQEARRHLLALKTCSHESQAEYDERKRIEAD